MKMINSPGIYDIAESAYHADPVETPSLTSSVADILMNTSPLHAWYAHPRLGGTYDDNSNRNMDLGSAIHDALLMDMSKVDLIPYDNWRTQDARDMKINAYKNDRIPLLEKDIEFVNKVYEKHKNHFKSMDNEKVYVWSEEYDRYGLCAPGTTGKYKIWCRSRIDSVDHGSRCIVDLKTTAIALSDWSRTRAIHYLMQVGMYRRALWNAHEDEYGFFFAVIENYEPYEIKMFGLDGMLIKLADDLANEACRRWSKLDTSDIKGWHGYALGPHEIDCKAWVIDKYHRLIEGA